MAKNIILSSGKRRTAIARARLMEVEKEDQAIIRINGVPIDQIANKFATLWECPIFPLLDQQNQTR